MKAKRATEAASGVAARRKRAAEAAKKRRRSQVEKALALKKADELLEESGKAEDIRQRRGSLGTLRPEDVSRGTKTGGRRGGWGGGGRGDVWPRCVLPGEERTLDCIGPPLCLQLLVARAESWKSVELGDPCSLTMWIGSVLPHLRVCSVQQKTGEIVLVWIPGKVVVGRAP